MPFGNNSVEISIISDIETHKSNFVSKARVQIKRISFLGTTRGGAAECVPVPDGWYAPARSVDPL